MEQEIGAERRSPWTGHYHCEAVRKVIPMKLRSGLFSSRNASFSAADVLRLFL
ncbi:hypothetical protein [Rhizobium yanglingense]